MLNPNLKRDPHTGRSAPEALTPYFLHEAWQEPQNYLYMLAPNFGCLLDKINRCESELSRDVPHSSAVSA